ncbi:MAG: Holliday junction branch migration protein RuvA [Candidatus Pacebacteria bacterium CG10_big_fil_rev_8_21_14_0_10_36_11]|nr:Holliday junction branch migration protein RuvA [Candidatus Pacearchaeota archaeon]OIP74595.1 MAG: Holliday junction DNA helicase RuvA [Candidatus Pacebacteria bacterium CG2_30_36_39]PIR65222.1 MAG: Holliday junction branch migration protein RuvA [Candidatus Pacebacteria bacterium CG10_big_fil_rev_8_21_14_0_10_36_11]PJC42560.1 MAG: Holliday junction branch migration protein RuvA [Candidatus Pacebacteria bacterium CG_4_9_14_0_2_um_filter_36_8]
MIGFLSGKVQKLNNAILIHTTGGVGYLVEVGPSYFLRIQDEQDISLFIYTHVREDALKLFGFQNQKDLSLFELVLSVSGVGPRIALAIIDTGAERLVAAVQNADVTFFSSIPRVGKKLAQKIIIELKSKLGGLKDLDLSPLSQTEQDVLDGLLGLGFPENLIHDVLKTLDTKQPVESLLKAAVKKLSKAI